MKVADVAELAAPFVRIVGVRREEAPAQVGRHLQFDAARVEVFHPQPREDLRQNAAQLRDEPRTNIPEHPGIRQREGVAIFVVQSPASSRMLHLRRNEPAARRQRPRQQAVARRGRQEVRHPHERRGPASRRRRIRQPAAVQDGDCPRGRRVAGPKGLQAPIRRQGGRKIPSSPMDVAKPLQRNGVFRICGEPPLQRRRRLIEQSARTEKRSGPPAAAFPRHRVHVSRHLAQNVAWRMETPSTTPVACLPS